MSKDGPFNPKALEASPDLIANQRKTRAGLKPKRPRADGRFTMVPFDRFALFRAQELVALRLLYLTWSERSQTVVLTNKGLAHWGVSRHQKLKALRRLERAGLIAVEWRRRKNPRVTLLDHPEG
jgi:hypothetical protein